MTIKLHFISSNFVYSLYTSGQRECGNISHIHMAGIP